MVVVEGEGLDADELEHELEGLGDSLLVVGDRTALKVHIHTDDPGRVLSLGVARGTIGGIEVANMHAQAHEREERLLHPAAAAEADACAVVAVAAGAGNRALFESFGAYVVDGGATMNPSTAEILRAIDRAPVEEAVVLPNNGNAIMSAEQAADASTKDVRIVPTRSIQAGLAAVVSFDPAASAAQNAGAMTETLRSVATGAVTVASRDVELNGVAVERGHWLGLAEGEPVAGGDRFDDVATAVLERLLQEPRGVLTLLTGEDAPVLDALVAHLREEHPEVELEVHHGGQPHYPLLLAAE
jgi:dihydroxyacetone kinase-like predicted kinase